MLMLLALRHTTSLLHTVIFLTVFIYCYNFLILASQTLASNKWEFKLFIQDISSREDYHTQSNVESVLVGVSVEWSYIYVLSASTTQCGWSNFWYQSHGTLHNILLRRYCQETVNDYVGQNRANGKFTCNIRNTLWFLWKRCNDS